MHCSTDFYYSKKSKDSYAGIAQDLYSRFDEHEDLEYFIVFLLRKSPDIVNEGALDTRLLMFGRV